MKYYRSHKIELKPNNVQETFLKKSCGTARFGYNMALEIWNKEYKAGNKPTAYKVDKIVNSLKKEVCPWSYEVSKCCIQSAVHNLGQSFRNFFQNPKHFKHPTFKKKGRKDSFKVYGKALKIQGKKLKTHKLLTGIPLAQELRLEGKLISCTISRKADKWFASINVEVNLFQPQRKREPIFVGVDLGIKTLAVLSDGTEFSSIKPHKEHLQRLRLLNKSLSRKVKGSKSYNKAKVKLGRLYLKISNIRKDYLHKITTALSNNYDVITIEDLSVRNMSRNHCLARSIMDQGWGMFKEMLSYKCEEKGVKLIKADRFFPSTKMCSSCGSIQKMDLSKRTYDCDCGFSLDRDLNASINLCNYGKIAVGKTVKACGEESSGSDYRTKLSSTKQELNKSSNELCKI